MKPQRRALSAIAVLIAVSSGLALGPVVSGAAAATGFCSASAHYLGTTIRWTGKGDGHSWTSKTNWSPATVPDVHQTPATYQAQYVCIGVGKAGKPASVTIPGTKSFHIAGIDVGQGAQLTVKPGGRLFLGATSIADVPASSVDRKSGLQLDAATLGGNSPLTVSGTLRWTGHRISGHKDVATQTSSECVFDPSIMACPGDTTPGGGKTIIAAGGKMLVDGTQFGGADLTDSRVIDNFGTITLTHFGYIAMDSGTKLIDEPHSSIHFDGQGGIYRGATVRGAAAPRVSQQGKLFRHGVRTDVAVVGVPLTLGTKASVSVLGGTIALDVTKLPKAPVHRGSGYGMGSCNLVKLVLCKGAYSTAADPQGVVVRTSTESAAPAVSNIAASLVAAPARVHGHPVLGRAISVTAPTKKTTHSTHLTFTYDATTRGLKPSTKPRVYRGTHQITLCAVHGLTAKNTSCVLSEGVAHSGSAGVRGDLIIIVISIQPEAKWVVTR
jgi:anti-sigma factor RsiW